MTAITASPAKAQYSQYGGIDEFFQANPDLPIATQYSGRWVKAEQRTVPYIVLCGIIA